MMNNKLYVYEVEFSYLSGGYDEHILNETLICQCMASSTLEAKRDIRNFLKEKYQLVGRPLFKSVQHIGVIRKEFTKLR